ncbi:MAG: hypothetical protein ABF243_11145 [Celeribacter marinus]
MQIISNIPLWVFPLFAGLLALGLMARRDRNAPVALFYGLPFLAILSLRAVSSIDAPAYVWGLFMLGYLCGTAIGFRAQQNYITGITRTRVSLRAEGLTLTTLMSIFALNFVKGTVVGVAPDVAQTPAFLISFTILAALIAGVFLGRSVAVIRRAYAPKAPRFVTRP